MHFSSSRFIARIGSGASLVMLLLVVSIPCARATSFSQAELTSHQFHWKTTLAQLAQDLFGTTTLSAISAPAGLRSIIYSSRAAVLVWTGQTNPGTTYEIKRNGVVRRATDSQRYYDNTLIPGIFYTYEVVAIDNLGQRSEPSIVTLNTNGSSNPTVETPAGLRSIVYSSKAIVLTWNVPTTSSLRYEIKRDGQDFKTITGGRFYDNTLMPGRSYTYQVVAINTLGIRSTPAFVMVDTPGGPPPGGGGTGNSPFTFNLDESTSDAITEPADYYQRDGYENLDIIRVDLTTRTTPGVCSVLDLSGCTLQDVLDDIDKTDALKVEIPVHFKSSDFADDGSLNNATLRQRGGGSRLGAQKSFRIKLNSKEVLWRNERFVQLNKSPFDSSRIRNKLAFDLMSEIPHLPSIRTQFVNLWIDDGEGPVDQGLYHHVERPNERFLENRGLNPLGNLYDASDFKFEPSDLSDVSINADGTPRNIDFFESALEISAGTDHRPLVEMLTAVLDPDRDFVSTIDQYFDPNNVMAWMATNILLNQDDAVRHNYYLYNPAGTKKFYFLPWDYDSALGSWKEPPNNYESDSLRQRIEFGYAVGEPNVFISRFYRIPGIHQQMLSAVATIRQNYLTDESIAEKAQARMNLSEPFQERAPDFANNPFFNASSVEKFAQGPAENEQALKTLFSIPMPPALNEPELDGFQWVFSWKPAFDVTGNSITYDLQISKSPEFSPADIVVSVTGIQDATDVVEQRINTSQLQSGTHYARLTARASSDPDRFWQISLNRLDLNGTRYYGVLPFDVP